MIKTILQYGGCNVRTEDGHMFSDFKNEDLTVKYKYKYNYKCKNEYKYKMQAQISNDFGKPIPLMSSQTNSCSPLNLYFYSFVCCVL